MQADINVPTLKYNLGTCSDFKKLSSMNRKLSGSLLPLINEVSIFTAAKVPKERNEFGNFDRDQDIHFVKWQNVSESKTQFFNSTLGIFSAFQSEWKETLKSNGQKQSSSSRKTLNSAQSQLLVATSHKYQQEILRHVRECKGNDAALFSGAHSIWHLAHLTCFENKPNVPVSSSICGWIRLNFSAKLRADFESIILRAHPSQDPQFWPLVYTCVARGFFDAASQLLSHLTQYQQKSSDPGFSSNPVEAFKALTQSSKIPKPEDFRTNALFKSAWDDWNQEATFLFDMGSLSSLKNKVAPEDMEHFGIVFGILAGDTTIILENCLTWQDALFGLLQFTHPLYDFRNVVELVPLLKDRFQSENLLDQIQLALLEQDLGLTLALSLQYDWWLVTHLVDLLEKGHFLDYTNTELMNYPESLGISEWHIVNFSEYLFTSPDLWKAALEYLVYCPTVGKEMLKEMICRIPLDSTQKTQKILLFCKKHGLEESRTTILRVLGRKALKSNLYNQAINYFLESDDLHYVAAIVDKLLEMYVRNGVSTYEDVVKGLASSSLFKSNRLAFLAKYHEFQELYRNKSYNEAADLSILLLTSGSAPKKFWKAILFDIIPLLEGQVQVFTVDQIMDLMRFAETCIVTERSKDYTLLMDRDSERKNLSSDDTLNVFKLAVSRALAAALVQSAKEGIEWVVYCAD